MDWDRTDAGLGERPGEQELFQYGSPENNYLIWAFLKKCQWLLDPQVVRLDAVVRPLRDRISQQEMNEATSSSRIARCS